MAKIKVACFFLGHGVYIIPGSVKFAPMATKTFAVCYKILASVVYQGWVAIRLGILFLSDSAVAPDTNVPIYHIISYHIISYIISFHRP